MLKQSVSISVWEQVWIPLQSHVVTVLLGSIAGAH